MKSIAGRYVSRPLVRSIKRSITDPGSYIDIIGPVVYVTSDNSSIDKSPAFFGTVDDRNAVVQLTINGLTYNCTVTGNNWNLAAGVVADIPAGYTNVNIFAADLAGNVSSSNFMFYRFDPSLLFASGEQGVWYDPNDLTPEKVNWRRNQFTYSEDFVGNWTPSRATLVFSTVPAPFGSSFATKLVEDSTTNYHGMYKGATYDVDTSYTFSIYLKAAERNKVRLHWNASSDALSIEVDLSTGTIIRGAVSASIADVGGGWWRVAKTMQRSSGNALCVNIIDENGVISYLGDGVSGIYVWGAQFEKGSVATEYQKITDFNSDFIKAFPNHTLFQDSAGTTPVTAAGQPVGLMLDKRLGLVRGSELVDDPGFNDPSAWTTGGEWTVSDGRATCVNSGGSSLLSKSLAVQVGVYVVVEFDYVASASAVLRVLRVGGSAVGPFAPSGSGRYRVILRPENTTTLFIQCNGVGASAEVDNITVRELPGNHAFQATAAARPILRQNSTTGAYYLETDGSDDWMQTNSIDFTSTDKVTVFAGVRKLSDGAQFIAELSASSEANVAAFALQVINTGNATVYRSRGSGLSRPAIGAALYAPTSAVLVGTSDISAPLSRLRINGVQSAENTDNQGTGNYGNYPLYLFRRGGTTTPFNGHFYGLLIVGRTTDVMETLNAERFFATGVGVTLA